MEVRFGVGDVWMWLAMFECAVGGWMLWWWYLAHHHVEVMM